MEHDRAVFLPVLSDISRIKAIGKNAVRLQGPDLPGSSDCVPQVPFELRSVERPFARKLFPAKFLGSHSGSNDSLAKFVLGLVPVFVSAESVVGSKSEFDGVTKAEVSIHPIGKLAER